MHDYDEKSNKSNRWDCSKRQNNVIVRIFGDKRQTKKGKKKKKKINFFTMGPSDGLAKLTKELIYFQSCNPQKKISKL